MAKRKLFTERQLEKFRKAVSEFVWSLPEEIFNKAVDNTEVIHDEMDNAIMKCLESKDKLKGVLGKEEDVTERIGKYLSELDEVDIVEVETTYEIEPCVREHKKTKKEAEVKDKADEKEVAEIPAKVTKKTKKAEVLPAKVKNDTNKIRKSAKDEVEKSPADLDVSIPKVVKPLIKEENKPLDVAISFDTTGSMYSVLATVRREIKETVKGLFSQFGRDKLRISVIAHGDYCDKGHPYVIKCLDFTDNIDKICLFVDTVESTRGGDSDECYELVLNTARTALDWAGGSQKILMVIGDCNPHNVGYICRNMDKPNEIDWRNECNLLNDMGVQIYGVHALHHYRSDSRRFYKTISDTTQGIYLTLDNFSDVLQLISATCYKNYSEQKYNEYVEIIKERKTVGRTLWDNIRRLNGEDVDFEEKTGYTGGAVRERRSGDIKFKELPGLEVVPAGRFQVIAVLTSDSIKGFVEKNGIKYKVGKAFYELTKTEDVQQYKEIILQDKESGDMYYGNEARKHLELKPQCIRSGEYAHEKIKPMKDDTYRVFVQSTSVNRKLVGGTNLLYEVEEI